MMAAGLPFTVAKHQVHLVSGLQVDVEEHMGRAGVVLYHPAAGGC